MKNFVLVAVLSFLSLSSFTQTAMDYYNTGNDKLDQKDFTGALEAFTKAIALDDTKSDFFMNRGIVKSEIGDWEFNEVDVDSDNPLTMDFSIKAVPTTILLVDDKVVHRQSGVISAVELRNLLQKPY
jgi:hypothetical protein